MSSGQKRLVFNTRERVLSVDHNRLQSFSAAARAQLNRYRFNDTRQNTFQYPGVSKPNTSGATPLSADIFAGLMVDPQTTSLLVTPGMIGCVYSDPAATADDSPYMLIDDPGVQTTGVLTFTANASGQVRIDLVECRPVVSEATVESDNRDIFNSSTGLFAPATVPKVKQFSLEYRIRTGVGGSGVPALAAGWLPLAAIVMASGAGDFNSCDFYDVRPLVEDRVEPKVPVLSAQYSPIEDAEYMLLDPSGTPNLNGFVFRRFGGYRAGGWLRRSSPSFSGSFTGTGLTDGDPDAVAVGFSENQVGGFVVTNNSWNYLAAFFPAGLPRWVRYSHSAVGGGLGRVPKGPRGILYVTSTPPDKNGLVSAVLGHGFTASDPGVVLLAMRIGAGGAFDGLNCNARTTNLQVAETVATVLPASGSSCVFSFGSGTEHPVGARALIVRFNLVMASGSPPSQMSIQVSESGTGLSYAVDARSLSFDAAGGPARMTVRIPLPSRYSPFGATSPSPITVTLSGSPFSTGSNQTAAIVGWEF